MAKLVWWQLNKGCGSVLFTPLDSFISLSQHDLALLESEFRRGRWEKTEEQCFQSSLKHFCFCVLFTLFSVQDCSGL